MAKMRLLLFGILAGAVAIAAGDTLDDFSNNLATDLGPLLTLFGDAMTKQYLSESTSSLDYLIFAMAPIGVLTAIVSTIRLCGHTSLRAFIGRSQEGEGVVEAELCTSTSRDVCELFNRGGIARVLGRPSVLELVYDAGKEPSSSGKPDAELRLSRKYFEGMKATDDWERVEGSVFGRPSKNPTLAEDFALNANLSLNVGIVKRPTWVYVSIAVTGVFLQAGILALAGVGVWILEWNLSTGRAPASRNYAPVMFIFGTVVMCAGMWACAYLIGQTTREVRFRRRGDKPAAQRPRLFWLQPGPQVIGDQSFDPYGYAEDTEHALHGLWMSSRKHLNEKLFEVNTILAVSAVLLGYIAQFIGLRGMKAWVALAQLAVTLLMSSLRGFLRMQRLGKESNQLGDIPDLVSGHELDWLSLEISQQKCKWHVTGQYQDAQTSTRISRTDSQGPEDSMEASTTPGSNANAPFDSDDLKSLGGNAPVSSTAPPIKIPRVDDIEQLLHIRKRLAHLTGHTSLERLSPSEYQEWKDSAVKVRAKANQISTALCQITEKVALKSQPTEIRLRIKAASHQFKSNTYSNQFIEVLLKQFYPGSQKGWTIDSAKIEAILSLWLWTLTSDPILRNDADASQNTSKQVVMERMVSASPDDRNWTEKASRAQGEMNLWLGPNAVKFQDEAIMVEAQEPYSFTSLWRSVTNENFERPHWENLSSTANHLDSPLRRFCGWTAVHQADREPRSDCKLRVQSIRLHPSQASVLDVCAQELFTTLLMSLGSHLTLGKAILVESAGTGRLENQTVETLANEFVQSGLGTYSEALLCIIPGLKGILPSPSPKELLALVTDTAETYRRNLEWNRAEVLLRWVCNYFESSEEDHGVSFEQVAQPFAKYGIIQRAYQMPSSPGLKIQPKILAAHYGGEDITIKAKWHFCHGEDIVVETPERKLPISDPWMWVRKSVSIIYRFNDGPIRGFVVAQDSNRRYTLTADRRDTESEKNTFDAVNYPSSIPTGMQIHAVIWGLEQVDDREVYDKLYESYEKKKPISLNNHFFKKDGWFNVVKSAAIVYSTNGTLKCISGRENTLLTFAY
ncbi:hypothetical protein AK830_g10197 [Neonectria ditissima]|uniref:Uncharacterized protein n=1 Tax=Neonectria ditissima TaxID=78410 RepID=A0A0P7BAW4_9HYPO|nr:hypothetical protein AK830_g10197 [Neonectria ditissima]